MGKGLRELGVKDFLEAGLSVAEAIEFDGVLREIVSLCVCSTDIWRQIVTRRVLKPSHPHSFHQLVYYSLYQSSSNASHHADPPLYWFPSFVHCNILIVGNRPEFPTWGMSWKPMVQSFLGLPTKTQLPVILSCTSFLSTILRNTGPLFSRNSQFHSLKLQGAFWILLIPQNMEELGFPALS
ncbi:hypothetical protein HN873_073105 [Arachis hypogaea]